MLCILFDTTSADVFQIHHPGQLLSVNTFGIINWSGRIGHGDRFPTKFSQFLYGKLGYISRSGNSSNLSLQGVTFDFQHFLGKIDCSVTSGLGPDQAATPLNSFSGQHTNKFILNSLILSKQEANLTTAHSDVACRHICIGSDMPVKLCHKTLAEAHDFVVWFSFRIKVRTSFSTSHWQRGEAILQYLLKSQKFQNPKVNRGVKAQTTFVGSDGRVHLYPVTPVDLHITFIINPGNPEHDDSFGFSDSLKNLSMLVSWILFYKWNQRFSHFVNCLMELWFWWVFGLDFGHELFNFWIHIFFYWVQQQ